MSAPQQQLAELESALDDCLLADRRRLRKRLQGLKRRLGQGKPVDRGLAEVARAVAASRERLQARSAPIVPDYPAELPVAQKREELLAAIRDNPVVIVCGETGSGKTTQLPKLCLELGLGSAGLVGHTQPRRIAARSVAARIAEELGTELGHTVGYKVRFGDRVGEHTRVKLMTDGILLAETQSDPLLEGYDCLIVDEAHERSLNIDFLLGYLKQLLPRRPDLKLIITSATIDPERFSRHFNDAPIVMVQGRTYPVEVRYRPLVAEDENSRDRSLQQAILEAVDEVYREGPGDTLIFLPGEREIRETAESLRKHHPPGVEIIPLYARLSAAEQQRVFKPSHGRRIVLSTNVAETSLTVPGIRYVIDPGTARISRYSVHSKVQRLPVEAISQASANQRKGRCGRVSEGLCIRLYSEEDFNGRPEFTDPEILRTNLASVILQMESLRLGHVEDFPFIEAPERRQINDGYRLLFELGAVDAGQRLTRLGRDIARLPIDPRLGRMLLASIDEGCLREGLIVVAALSVHDPRERPLERQQAADEKHRRFYDPRSDFISLINLWDWYQEQSRHLSQSKLRKLCQQDFLAFMRMREWRDIHHQLRGMLHEMGVQQADDSKVVPFVPGEKNDARKLPEDALHRALLSGLLGQVGLRLEPDKKQKPAKGKRRPLQEYQAARGRRFAIFPGSAAAKQPPKWLMAFSLVETTRLFGRTVAAINPRWLEELADHLVQRSYSEPHWQRRSGQVAARETVTLYGLTISSGRRVNYGPIAPAEAREIFIREALVNGEFDTQAEFFAHNQALIEDLEELEAKARRPDILVDEETLFRFYDQRIPEGIYNAPAFDKWRRQAEREQPRLLFMSEDFLKQREPGEVSADRFPPQMDFDGLKLPLEYRHQPGAEDDGVTLVVPLPALNQVQAARCEWLVPGLLEEKLAALIKTLPKSLRRNVVPAPDFARAAAQALVPGNRSLTEALAHELLRMTGVTVPAEAWQPQELPDHLRLRFRLVDAGGNTLAAGRDLEALRGRHGAAAETGFAELESGDREPGGLEREGLKDWDFDSLPESLEVANAGIVLTGYPALTDQGDSVAIEILDDPHRARQAHHRGLRRLFMLRMHDTIKHLRQRLPGIDRLCLQYTQVKAVQPGVELGRAHSPCEQLKEHILLAAVERSFLTGDELPRERGTFLARLEAGRSELVEQAEALCRQLDAVLGHFFAIRKRLKGSLPLTWVEAAADINDQLDHLVYKGFVLATPAERLAELPRYLQALEKRLDKLDRAPDKDRAARVQIQPLWQTCKQRAEQQRRRGRENPALEAFRWALEELRVSLFAQELGTRQPVSVKRLEKMLRELPE